MSSCQELPNHQHQGTENTKTKTRILKNSQNEQT